MFILIGGINTFSGVVFAAIYSKLIESTNASFACGYITSLIMSYLLNSKFTFNESVSLKVFVKFAISYIPNFIIQNIVVFIIYNQLGFHKLIAFGAAAVLGIPITFFFMKVIAFGKHKQGEKNGEE